MCPGSDLVYSAAGARAFASIVGKLLRAGKAAECLYAHTAERWGSSGFDAASLAVAPRAVSCVSSQCLAA